MCTYTLQQCLHTFGEPSGNWNESIYLDRFSNQILYTNDKNSVLLDMKMDNINVGALSATLGTDIISWRVVGRHIPANTNETVCSFANNYRADCGSGSFNSINVGLWDVIVFNFPGTKCQFCGVIWITAIELDKSVQGVPQVCIQICYPIY